MEDTPNLLSINEARDIFAKGETELTVYSRQVTLDISLTLNEDGTVGAMLHIPQERDEDYDIHAFIGTNDIPSLTLEDVCRVFEIDLDEKVWEPADS